MTITNCAFDDEGAAEAGVAAELERLDILDAASNDRVGDHDVVGSSRWRIQAAIASPISFGLSS